MKKVLTKLVDVLADIGHVVRKKRTLIILGALLGGALISTAVDQFLLGITWEDTSFVVQIVHKTIYMLFGAVMIGAINP